MLLSGVLYTLLVAFPVLLQTHFLTRMGPGSQRVDSLYSKGMFPMPSLSKELVNLKYKKKLLYFNLCTLTIAGIRIKKALPCSRA